MLYVNFYQAAQDRAYSAKKGIKNEYMIKNAEKFEKTLANGEFICYNQAIGCHSGKKVAFQSNLIKPRRLL